MRADLIAAETKTLLSSVARVVLAAQRGRLFEQLERIPEPVASDEGRAKARRFSVKAPPGPARVPDLEFFNGLGGFARNGREYVTVLGPGQSTPAPWINVIANPTFGFQTGTEGGGYTWSVNSRENQITPWSNDPVSDRPGEAFYLRDDDTGDSGLRPRCRSATPRRPMSPATAADTAGSSMSRTRLLRICCNTSRSTIRSRFRASC